MRPEGAVRRLRRVPLRVLVPTARVWQTGRCDVSGWLVTLTCGCTTTERDAPSIGDDYCCPKHGDDELAERIEHVPGPTRSGRPDVRSGETESNRTTDASGRPT